MRDHCAGRAIGAALFALLAMVTAPALSMAATVPDCTLHIGSQTTHLSQFRGKVLYIDFWASWCTPCLLSFPFMNELHKNYAARGLQVVGVGMDEKAENAQRFLARHAASFAVALNGNAQCARDFGVAAMPSSFLVDRAGNIRLVHQGFRPGDGEQLRAMVEKLLDEGSAR